MTTPNPVGRLSDRRGRGLNEPIGGENSMRRTNVGLAVMLAIAASLATLPAGSAADTGPPVVTAAELQAPSLELAAPAVPAEFELNVVCTAVAANETPRREHPADVKVRDVDCEPLEFILHADRIGLRPPPRSVRV